jgi:hypothetical protein
MIRQWFILSVLFLVTAGLLWNFVTEVLLYSPLEKIQATEKDPQEKAITEADFKAAWGPEIHSANLFSLRRGVPPKRPKVRVTKPPKPVTPPPPKAVKPTPRRPVLKLNGIIVNQFGEYVAYIVRNSQAAVPLREGDVLDDIQVISINERAVKLMWLEEEIELSLSKIETLTR